MQACHFEQSAAKVARCKPVVASKARQKYQDASGSLQGELIV